MKLLFLLLFSNHYSGRDHKENEKKKENWILPTVRIYWDRISRINIKINKDIQ